MNNKLTVGPREQQYQAEVTMAGVAENLNVLITLKPATKVARRWKRFSDCATIKRLFHSAVGTLFWTACMCYII